MPPSIDDDAFAVAAHGIARRTGVAAARDGKVGMPVGRAAGRHEGDGAWC
jgi:hypothetical protein